MNIFFLSSCPRRCARWHCDKHVIKMILESCQMLYAAHHIVGDVGGLVGAPSAIGKTAPGYALAHKNHPCTKWVRGSLAHYMWLCTLAVELLEEYARRFGVRADNHSCYEHVMWLSENFPARLEDCGWSAPALAMADEFKIGRNVIASYRNYYRKGKAEILTYRGRQRPHWLAAGSGSSSS